MLIAEMRKRAGLSQRELGEKLGMSQQGVASWESGRAEPSVGMLLTLADLFGCTVDELLRGDAAEKNNPA